MTKILILASSKNSSSICVWLPKTTLQTSIPNPISFAATNDLSLNGYNDWFLPSVDELQEIYNNKTVINTTSIANSGVAIEEGFESYWSSTQVTNATANAVRFSDGIIGEEYKSVNYINVRAVRHWTDF